MGINAQEDCENSLTKNNFLNTLQRSRLYNPYFLDWSFKTSAIEIHANRLSINEVIF